MCFPIDRWVRRNALGARGIDIIATTAMHKMGQPETKMFPLYDGHGNMVATLARNGSSFSLSNARKYDAWGGVRTGTGPATGHCANLGHTKDAESGLVYMRARYYGASVGRFISEDPARDGWNWYAYCHNDPVNNIDCTGRSALSLWDELAALIGVAAYWAQQSGEYKLFGYVLGAMAALLESIERVNKLIQAAAVLNGFANGDLRLAATSLGLNKLLSAAAMVIFGWELHLFIAYAQAVSE